MMLAYAIEVEGLSAYRAADRLRREGIPLLSVKKCPKNRIEIVINAKERKKVFTILRHSCYNIKKFCPVGLMRILQRAVRAVGLLFGGIVAALSVLFLQGRVLRIQVTGSGAYLEPQIVALLGEHGVGFLSPMPAGNELIPAVLSLPRVHFVSFKGESGVLTVDVEVGEETEPLAFEPLLAPIAGTVEELVVFGGTPLVEVGGSVEKGQKLVAPYVLLGEEERPSLVIARVVVRFPVAREYALSEEGARLQALLDFGEISELHTTRTAQGWLVEGTGHAEAVKNFG